ncbi:hypothetical protein [Desertivirga brevis]|uniref:hypothetical protein n=1 Tax=Desertivirga brevis TaxID=2810310 RepID=UPI001A966F13|nr:hypothetical protein [Pedobacter sp. SYSU D00873]
MKHLQILLFMLISFSVAGQVTIRDRHITRQQERMVFKQWNRNQFTPRKGFLGLNPLYWLTWGLHPDYPKKDLRPLGPAGPQTQRLAMAAVMENAVKQARAYSDTLRNTAISEVFNYSGEVSELDPLWQLYYKAEFRDLLEHDGVDHLRGLPLREKQYLVDKGIYSWYAEESQILLERLGAARRVGLDRGSRILAYHHILQDYHKLQASWEMKRNRIRLFLNYAAQSRRTEKILYPSGPFNLTDRQIADKIIRKLKL